MKIRILIACLFCCFFGLAANVKLTVNWTFLNVIEGYDHDNRIVVTVDGKEVGQSDVFKQTHKSSYSVMIPKGKHEVKVMDYALYDGQWEEHTKSNNYSIDAFYEGIVDFQGNVTIDMVFDIDKETSDIRITGPGKAAGTTVPLTITWKFTNVIEGHDYDNRIVVYVDGKQVATSAIFLQSKPGTLVVDVSKGNHAILVENYAYYNGAWEVHSTENDYSIDAIYSTNMSFTKKKRKISLIFDIETEQTKARVL